MTPVDEQNPEDGKPAGAGLALGAGIGGPSIGNAPTLICSFHVAVFRGCHASIALHNVVGARRTVPLRASAQRVRRGRARQPPSSSLTARAASSMASVQCVPGCVRVRNGDSADALMRYNGDFGRLLFVV
jgi:hypothetical protein